MKRSFRSILPHEPPIPDNCKGYMQIQGSFSPKIKPDYDGCSPVQQLQPAKSTLERCLFQQFQTICNASSAVPPIQLSVIDENPPFLRVILEYSNWKEAQKSATLFRHLPLTPKLLMEGTELPVPTSQRLYKMSLLTTHPLSPHSWPHSTPPKFRRCIARPGESEADMERLRLATRYLVVSNLLNEIDGNSAWDNEQVLIAQAIRDTLNMTDIEVFVPTLAAKRTKCCHLGFRTAEEARLMAQKLQEQIVHWKFPNGIAKSGCLFVDFAVVTYRAKDPEETKDMSRSQCTSTTDHITIPGLILSPDFVTLEQEEALLAVLLGPFAPWAPKQRASRTVEGTLNRAVQHYGYIFDYETADVLRYDDSCPPIPALEESVAEEELDKIIDTSVAEYNGWNVVAGVVEKIRRYSFENGKMYPLLNQITLNQYRPGEGIGSHIDTPSAFDDGLISLSLGSGIVMEFRNGIEKKLLYLPRRSLLLMSSDARYKWEHMIVTRKTDTVNDEVLPRETRASLTLRTALAADGRSVLPLRKSSVFPPVWNPKTKQPNTDPLRTPDCETNHVHAVYDAIATQWHHTRGKRGALWAGATQFIQALPPASIIADVGCGDGKYFPTIWEAGSYVIGTDISEPLLRTSLLDEDVDSIPDSRRVSKERQYLKKYPAVAVADCLQIPIRSDSCDAAICVAVLHHLSTFERRKRCIEELVRIVRHGGLVNVQAWALEQEEGSKRRFASNDVFVPFNVQPKYLSINDAGPGKDDKLKDISTARRYSEALNADFNEKKGLVIFKRFCHLYKEGEIDEIAKSVEGLKIVDSGFESGNYYLIFRINKQRLDS